MWLVITWMSSSWSSFSKSSVCVVFIPSALCSLFRTKPAKLFNTYLIIHDLAGHSFIYTSYPLNILFPPFAHAWRDFSQVFSWNGAQMTFLLEPLSIRLRFSDSVWILLSAEGLSQPILTKRWMFFFNFCTFYLIVYPSITPVQMHCIFVNVSEIFSLYFIILFCAVICCLGMAKYNDNY